MPVLPFLPDFIISSIQYHTYICPASSSINSTLTLLPQYLSFWDSYAIWNMHTKTPIGLTMLCLFFIINICAFSIKAAEIGSSWAEYSACVISQAPTWLAKMGIHMRRASFPKWLQVLLPFLSPSDNLASPRLYLSLLCNWIDSVVDSDFLFKAGRKSLLHGLVCIYWELDTPEFLI